MMSDDNNCCFCNGRLIVISGPSGAGKDTIVNSLLLKDERFSLSVSATTRAPRPGEKDGVNYYYVNVGEFEKMIKDGDFIEYAKYGSSYYGTLKSDVKKRINNGKIVVLVIEVQGAENVRKIFPDCLSIFIMPPSFEILEQRLRDRCSENEDEIKKRLKIAKTEVEKRFEYDIVVENDILDETVKNVHNKILEKLDLT